MFPDLQKSHRRRNLRYYLHIELPKRNKISLSRRPCNSSLTVTAMLDILSASMEWSFQPEYSGRPLLSVARPFELQFVDGCDLFQLSATSVRDGSHSGRFNLCSCVIQNPDSCLMCMLTTGSKADQPEGSASRKSMPRGNLG